MQPRGLDTRMYDLSRRVPSRIPVHPRDRATTPQNNLRFLAYRPISGVPIANFNR